MKTIELLYGKSLSDGNYGNTKIEIRAIVEEGEDQNECLNQLQEWVHDKLGMDKPTPATEPVKKEETPKTTKKATATTKTKKAADSKKAEDTPAPSLEDLKKELVGVIKKHGKPAAVSLLTAAGFAKTEEVPEEKRAELIKKAKELLKLDRIEEKEEEIDL